MTGTPAPSCPACGRPAAPAELSAYGRCEDCYVRPLPPGVGSGQFQLNQAALLPLPKRWRSATPKPRRPAP